MPIFEYSCRECGDAFELLIRGDERAVCPSCESQKVEKQFSLPALSTSGTHDKAMRAAKKRDSAQAKERTYTQRQYELNHD